MSRIKSKKLYRYLKENGGFKNPHQLKKLKREYRRQYQNQWQRQQRKKQHEVRFFLTKDEYGEIKNYCQNQSTTPTELAKELVLSHGREQPFLPNREQLLAIAKQLGLSINQLSGGGNTDTIITKLLSAEAILLNYLKP